MIPCQTLNKRIMFCWPTWNAKMVREKTMMVVIPAAMITASVSYFMLT